MNRQWPHEKKVLLYYAATLIVFVAITVVIISASSFRNFSSVNREYLTLAYRSEERRVGKECRL